MSEAELMEISNAMWSNGISLMALYITVLSGYILISYNAGKDMSSNQIRITNFLYIGLCIFILLSFIGFGSNAIEFDRIAFDMSTQQKSPARDYLFYGGVIFFAFCHLASLKFMFDIRRENER